LTTRFFKETRSMTASGGRVFRSSYSADDQERAHIAASAEWMQRGVSELWANTLALLIGEAYLGSHSNGTG
jgi:hypothetical protein